jgi:hypothetical protein
MKCFLEPARARGMIRQDQETHSYLCLSTLCGCSWRLSGFPRLSVTSETLVLLLICHRE